MSTRVFPALPHVISLVLLSAQLILNRKLHYFLGAADQNCFFRDQFGCCHFNRPRGQQWWWRGGGVAARQHTPDRVLCLIRNGENQGLIQRWAG